jgi:DNA-binding HxlR family transcriptional regulator
MDARADDVPCSVEFAVRLIGGKWKMLVLRALLFHTALRYNELLARIEGISPKELTRNLRELEEAGLVSRNGTQQEQKVEYQLTEVGSELMPAFQSLAPVGEKLMAVSARVRGG